MSNNNKPLNQIPVSPATPVEPTEAEPAQPKSSPKKVSNPIYYFLVICGGVALLTWLIGSQQQSPLTAQANTPTPIATGWEVEITRTVTATLTPMPTPTEVMYVIATVIFPPTPLPIPTIGPGPLADYKISEPTYVQFEKQVDNFLGVFNNGELLAYNIPLDRTQPTHLIAFNDSGKIIRDYPLPLDSAKLKNSWYPIRLLGKTNYLVYQEKISDTLFNLKMSDLTGQNLILLNQASYPAFSISDDGFLAYIKNKKIVISQPLKNNSVIIELSLSDYSIDTTDENFSINLSSEGKYLAISGSHATLRIIDVLNKQITQVHQGENYEFIAEMVWSPDGSRLAYRVDGSPNVGTPSSTLYLVDPDGTNSKMVRYWSNQQTGDPAILARITWNPHSLLMATHSGSYMCKETCQNALVLITKDGNYFREIFESNETLRLLGWSSDGQSLVYRCTPYDGNYYTRCSVNISK